MMDFMVSLAREMKELAIWDENRKKLKGRATDLEARRRPAAVVNEPVSSSLLPSPSP
jgi:malate/lactate dehydrogenase